MALRVKYYWRELTEDGLLKPFRSDPWSTSYFGGYGYDTEEEALEAFESAFCKRNDVFYMGRGDGFYMSAQYVIVKCYGVWE